MRTVWTSDTDFTLDGITYRSATTGTTGDAHRDVIEPPGQLIFKGRPVVTLYEDLIEAHRPPTCANLEAPIPANVDASGGHSGQ